MRRFAEGFWYSTRRVYPNHCIRKIAIVVPRLKGRDNQPITGTTSFSFMFPGQQRTGDIRFMVAVITLFPLLLKISS